MRFVATRRMSWRIAVSHLILMILMSSSVHELFPALEPGFGRK